LRDRTWSFWNVRDALPQRWQELAQTHWKQWRVSSRDCSVQCSGEVTYASIRADMFYALALDLIAAAPHIEWRKRAGVAQANAQKDGVHLVTTAGEQLRTQVLFDSRPPALAAQGEWVQQFKGWEVSSRQPCFDAQCLDLMAVEPSSRGLHFIYCLSYSATQALVETTWIKHADARDDADAELREALAKRWSCTDYEITFREQGALPLWPLMQPKSEKVVRIGRAGGALRASTGYAFCATLHQSSALAQSLGEHLRSNGTLLAWQVPDLKSSAMDAWMDRILFRVLERDWAEAPQYFMNLFEHVPADVLARFLHGASSWQDRIAVMRALPSAPFLRAALT
jgi:lycopene beta-cyclase